VTVRGTAGLAARGGGRAASVALADRPCSCRATQSSLGAIDFSSRTGRAACRHSGIGGPRTPGWNCSSPRRGGTVHPPSRPQGWNSSLCEVPCRVSSMSSSGLRRRPVAAICEVCRRRKRRHRAQRGDLPPASPNRAAHTTAAPAGDREPVTAPTCDATGADVPTPSRHEVARSHRAFPADIVEAAVALSLIAPLTFPTDRSPVYVVSVVRRGRVVRLAATGTSITCLRRQTPATTGPHNTNLT
jgi:hypothetical protein